MARNFEVYLKQDEQLDGFPLVEATSVDVGAFKFVAWDAGLEPLMWWHRRTDDEKRKFVFREVDKAIRFLKNIHPLLPKNRVYFSYGFKHIVEDAVGEYISNGALIYAALLCSEYKVVKNPQDRLNAYISLRRGIYLHRAGADKDSPLYMIKPDSGFFCEARQRS
jgi:hypothetical protein